MLSDLSIRDLIIVESIDVSFVPGLNVLTGETGSGKSILVKALKLVLGAKGGADLVRAGADHAVVEALFELPEPLRRRLADHDLPDDEQLVVRRVLRASGRSRATINGHLVTQGQLRALARGLVDISSQHEHHSLVDPTTHLEYLDAFGQHEELVEVVRERVGTARKAADALAALHRDLAQGNADTLRWQAQEIDGVGPVLGELDQLDEELVRLEHAERLGGAAARAAEAFAFADPSLVQQIGRHEDALARAAEIDGELQPLVDTLASVRDQLEDVSRELGTYARRLDTDPARLEDTRDRRRTLLSLCRKHACDLDGVVEKRARIAEQLARIDDAEHQLARLTAEAERTLADAGEVARDLSRARRATAEGLSQAITSQLHDLGMGAARVEVSLERLGRGEPGGLRFDGARLGEQGLDDVELLIAPNPGEPPRPLAKVASGGELSRSLLAIKRVLARVGPVGLYVFDEVDTGVGGAIAESIAQKMAEVAKHHQVLCITHQAPIAAYGEAHHVVTKRVEGERTFSEVRALPDATARVDELARMLAGITVTDAARQTARELLDAAST